MNSPSLSPEPESKNLEEKKKDAKILLHSVSNAVRLLIYMAPYNNISYF